MMLERQLTRAGYVVDTADDGEEALAKILDGQYQILLTDWDMPGMDGRTLCKRVREANLPTYVYMLLLTSHLRPTTWWRASSAGADDYLRKPANPGGAARAPECRAPHRAAGAVAARGERQDSAALDHGFAGRHVQPALPERPARARSGSRAPLRAGRCRR